MEQSVLIAGAGSMGAGIAFVAARGGYSVELVEPDPGARERGRTQIAKNAERAGDASILQRVRFLDRMPERSDASIAIEAVPERLALKRDVLRTIEAAIAPSALLASNTSSLSISELAAATAHPERVLGLHFFNPPAAMKLVEIVWAQSTSDEAIAAAHAFVERIEKTAVLAADTPGFIVNRVARPLYLQAMRALENGTAPVEELDALTRAAGFRMGPFELIDLIGADVNLAVSESVFERTGAARLEPLDLQRQMVAEGRLGRKSGEGFYDYTSGVPERLDLAVEPPDDVNADEVVALIGFGGVADELAALLEQRFAHVQRIESDELLDELRLDSTIVFDVGDGTSDRGERIAELDSLLAPECAIFVDAYATDLQACMGRLQSPGRLVGYGILGSLESQQAVEIVDTAEVSDDTLELAQEFFGAIGKGVVLVENQPGLFLGRTIASIVNEAVIVVHEEIATAEDIDVAMRLGTNYPIGPIAWGREIGGARVARILRRVAHAEGDAFAPHRALWVLDVHDEAADEPIPLEELGVKGPVL